ncbi:MAG: galactitol-1-phosphate 5-dehydrogenase [Clostridiales Family XIII bacterium]|jgi:L-iditol 2-dehydrogenase|nr:galactitol-1-phosphate 5-dehydrogenase [Clostridiales Family XIII bacterium]
MKDAANVSMDQKIHHEMTMKACVLHKIGDLRYEDVPVPEVAPGEVLLKVRAAGICGSDIPRVFTKGTYHFPTIPGHEFAGEVVKVNDGDEHLLGGRFAVFPLLPCFRCDACAAAEYQQCADYDYYGSRRDGAFAEFLAVKKWNLVPVPDGVSYEEAAMAEPCAVALHALKRFGVNAGDTVAIFGAGTIGLLAGQAAKAWKADNVILFDVDARKLDFAKRMGFEYAINSAREDPAAMAKSLTGGAGADLCLDAAGVSQAVEASVKSARRSGKVILMGNPAGDIHLSQKGYWEILRGQLTLKGTWNSSYNNNDNDWTHALDFIKDGMFDLNPLIMHRFSFAESDEAFRIAADPSELSVKVMFINE